MDRAEATGLGVAVTGHVALLGVLTLGLAGVAHSPVPTAPIEVSFVEEVGLTSAAPEPVVTPPEQGMAPLAGPPEDSAAQQSEVEPVAEPRPAAPQPRPAPQPRERRAQPQPRPQPKQSTPRAQPSRSPPSANRSGQAEADRRPRLGQDILKGIGSDPSPSTSRQAPAAMTGEARASINSAIRRALLPCERQPLPSPEAGAIEVDVRVSLARDGSLANADVLRVRNPDPELQMYERRMRDLALNVIRQCTPIRGLPAELYDVPRGWRQFTYTFDPRQS